MRRAGPTKGARVGIVLAHGRGADGSDMLGLMAAAGLPDVAVAAPEAAGRSWWPTSFLAPTAAMEPQVLRGVAAMTEAVRALEAEGVARRNIWLGGFSQGACLALETFARAEVPLAGVFGFSGALVGTADAGGGPQDDLYGHGAKRLDYAGVRTGARVWMSVHAADPHIPLRRFQETAGVLRDLGATVDTQVYPGQGHGMAAPDMAALRRLLQG